MAIVVQEKQKNGGGVMRFLVWIVLLVVLAAGAYYVFFKKPELIERAGSPVFEGAKQLAEIRLDPEEIANDPFFQSLRSYVPARTATTTGRANPFLGF